MTKRFRLAIPVRYKPTAIYICTKYAAEQLHSLYVGAQLDVQRVPGFAGLAVAVVILFLVWNPVSSTWFDRGGNSSFCPARLQAGCTLPAPGRLGLPAPPCPFWAGITHLSTTDSDVRALLQGLESRGDAAVTGCHLRVAGER